MSIIIVLCFRDKLKVTGSIYVNNNFVMLLWGTQNSEDLYVNNDSFELL